MLADETLAEMRQPVPPAVDYGLGVRLLPYADGVLAGHTGSMPGFQATLFVDPLSHVGVVALTNATTGFLRHRARPGPARRATRRPPSRRGCRPTTVPDWARELLGYWHWGNTAFEVRWHDDRLELRDLSAGGVVDEQFDRSGDRIVGVAGYHHGETLHVVRRDDGSIDHLECATFVYTREPYPDGP